MITSPILGLTLGFIIMGMLYFLLRNWRPVTVNRLFGKLQLFSAAYMGFSHGTNDAQKTMGIIFLALVAGTTSGTFDSFGSKWNFLHAPENLGSMAASHVEWGPTGRRARTSAVAHFAKAAGRKATRQIHAEALKTGRDQSRRDQDKLFAELAAGKFDVASVKPAVPIARKFKEQPEAPEAAVAWFKAKAESGSDDAILALGVAYLNGAGVAKDETEARLRAGGRTESSAALFTRLSGLERDWRTKNEAVARRISDSHGIKVICALTMCGHRAWLDHQNAA
jgi:phosphate/sulfate permease